MRQFVLILLLLLSTVSFSQKFVQIQVLDKTENFPLPGAHICLVSKNSEPKYYAADIEGTAKIEYIEAAEITISYMGYITETFPLKKKTSNKIGLKKDLLSLEQVVVTATVAPQKVDQSIYKIQVISSKEMEKQGVQNVRDALRFQPNINLVEDGVLGSQIIMQGLEGQHVKFLIDGMPIIGRQDGNVDLSQIDMTQVDHIEIIEGPMSVVYGSNALAGTINIITKKNKYYTLSGNATAYAESVGQYNASMNLQGKVGKSSFGISSGYRFFEGYDLNSSNRSMDWNPKNQINAEGFYGVKIKGFDTKFGVRFSGEDLTYKGEYREGPRAIDTQFLTDRITYYGQFSNKFNSKQTLTGLLSYNTYKRTGQEYVVDDLQNSEVKKGDATEDAFETLNGRVSYGVDFSSKLKWQIGYELTDEKGSGEKVVENNGLTENAIWTDMQLKLTEKLIFQPGLRYLHHNVYTARLIYSTHLKWNPNTTWQSRISYAKGFRAPSMKELYMDFVDTNHMIFGNQDLLPETSHNITGNISKTFHFSDAAMLRLNVSGFYNYLTDVIELTTSEEDNQAYFYRNISEKKTQGGNISLNYGVQNFKLQTGVVLTGIGYDLRDSNNFNFSYATDFMGMIGYTFRKQDLTMQFDYKYTAERVQLFLDATDEIQEGSVEGYQMLNFSTTKNFFNKKLTLTAGAKNILDVKTVANSTSGGAHSSGDGRLIAWGRSFFISIKYNLNKI